MKDISMKQWLLYEQGNPYHDALGKFASALAFNGDQKGAAAVRAAIKAPTGAVASHIATHYAQHLVKLDMSKYPNHIDAHKSAINALKNVI